MASTSLLHPPPPPPLPLPQATPCFLAPKLLRSSTLQLARLPSPDTPTPTIHTVPRHPSCAYPPPTPPPINSTPQRPLLHPRGPPVHPHLNREPPMFRGGKRPGPPFGGGRGGPFYPPKRPFFPPRY
ncbi:uncharacterized protein LOC127915294 [Oncorhynchus keta]|uniref:uncharacterized protein LOC127915294 n=1 Tax=Oncorhynchus keta TaxID=8018 RepID=UPI00227C24C5|nr:uncharacterized protein LOC127915294 [Oncorhynchus keta]